MTEYHFDASRFVIDSHRGAFKEGLLENSTPAFKQSVKEGANCLETDIRITGDGNIVLVHNKTIDHIAEFATTIPDVTEFDEQAIGPLKSHTLEYLQSLKFENGAKILDFPEYLQVLKDLKVGAQIELKEFGFEDLILQQ